MGLNDYLQMYQTITLEEMDKVRLMNRIDTKYITTLSNLELLLSRIVTTYRLQQIDGQTNMPYYTCYFDTVSYRMFTEHQRGRKVRQKIRIREYENSRLTFLEIKNKNNKGRTDKKRIQAECGKNIMPYADFINKYTDYPPESLLPQLQNHFNRITLVNNDMTERLTIDTDLCFRNFSTQEECKLTDLVVIELKRNGHNESYIQKLLHEQHIYPCGFSKYCIGLALTNRQIKQNRLKNKIRTVQRICSGLTYGCSGTFNGKI